MPLILDPGGSTCCDRQQVYCPNCGDAWCSAGSSLEVGQPCPNGCTTTWDDDNDYGEMPDDETYNLHYYSFRPNPMTFFGGEDAPYHVGVELEIGTGSRNATPVYEWAASQGFRELFFCKEDGSVEGFEIVTQPMTPEFFDSVNWSAFFTMLNRAYPDYEEGESSEHGIHVHVSRTAFQNGHTSSLARWLYLFNRNRTHVVRIARRSGSSWARFAQYPVSLLLPERFGCSGSWDFGPECPCGCGQQTRTWIPGPGRWSQHRRRNSSMGRYMATNLQPPETVEVRVFRSTRDAREFQNAVHLVTSTVDFVRAMQPCHATVNATRWSTYREWVSEQPRYAALSSALS